MRPNNFCSSNNNSSNSSNRWPGPAIIVAECNLQGQRAISSSACCPSSARTRPGFSRKCRASIGDVVYIPLGRQHIYYLGHPEMIRDVLVTRQNKFKKSRMLERARVLLGDGLLTSEGEHHRRQRRLVAARVPS